MKKNFGRLGAMLCALTMAFSGLSGADAQAGELKYRVPSEDMQKLSVLEFAPLHQTRDGIVTATEKMAEAQKEVSRTGFALDRAERRFESVMNRPFEDMAEVRAVKSRYYWARMDHNAAKAGFELAEAEQRLFSAELEWAKIQLLAAKGVDVETRYFLPRFEDQVLHAEWRHHRASLKVTENQVAQEAEVDNWDSVALR